MDIRDKPEPPPRVRVAMTAHGPNGSMKIEGLNQTEIDLLTAAVSHGQQWVRIVNGRIEFAPIHEAPPTPTEDPMLPQWRRPSDVEGSDEYQIQLFEPVGGWKNQSASIVIQHLCGYNYTPEGYKANAEFLEECGFVCARSRRINGGAFYEIWYLSGLWAAKGRLKEALYNVSEEDEMKVALACIRGHVTFGTLDLAVQRLCQVLD